MKVIAVIGDLVGSKALVERRVLQRKLKKQLERVSREAKGLASPYTLTLGDEFQAVYRGAESVLGDVVMLLAEIHPVRARLALGVGSLSTSINAEQALGMDGPAFHQARAALSALKADGRLLRVAGEEVEKWALTNHVLNLLSHHIEGWTQNRLRVLAGLLRGRTVKEIEEGLEISRVAVYKNIRAAALDDIAGICQELSAALQRTLREK